MLLAVDSPCWSAEDLHRGLLSDTAAEQEQAVDQLS